MNFAALGEDLGPNKSLVINASAVHSGLNGG
jgi:hypothetical protein